MPFKESTEYRAHEQDLYAAPREQYLADLEDAIANAGLDEIIAASYADSEHNEDRPATRFDNARELYVLHDRSADGEEAARAMHYACADAIVEYIHEQVEQDGSLHDATLTTLHSYSLESLPHVVQAIGKEYVAASVKHQALLTENAIYGVADFEQQVAQLARQQHALVEAFSHVGVAHGVNEAAGHKVYGFIASQRLMLEELPVDTSVVRQRNALDTLVEEAFHLRLNKTGEYVNDDTLDDETTRVVKADAHRISPTARIVTTATAVAFGAGLLNISSAAAAPIPTRHVATTEIEGVTKLTPAEFSSVKMTFNPSVESNFIVADYVTATVTPGTDIVSGKTTDARIKAQSNAKPPIVELDESALAVLSGDAVVYADVAKEASNKLDDAPVVAELPPMAIATESGAYIVPAEAPVSAPEEAKPAETQPETTTPAVDAAEPAKPEDLPESVPEDSDFFVPTPEAPAPAETPAAPAENSPEAKAPTAEVKKQTPVERWTKAAEHAGDIYKWGKYKQWVVEETVEQTLKNGGTLVGASGFVGSAKGESNYVPSVIEHGNGIGLGIFQHSFGRRDNLEAGAKKEGVNVYKNTRENVDYQVGFSIGESKKRTERDGTGNEWVGLNKQKNPALAAAYFQWNFERPAAVEAQSIRTTEATNVYNQIIAADKDLQAKAAAEAKAKAKAKADAAAKEEAAKAKERAESDTKFKVVNGPVSAEGYGAPLTPEAMAKYGVSAKYDGYSKEFSNQYLEENGVYPHHDGLDIATPPGEEVLAVDDGTVFYVGDYRPGQENQLVVIDHGINEKGQHIMTNYQHLQPGSFKVKAGDKINRGTVIALSGASGTNGAHVHFTFITDDPNKDGRVGVVNPDFESQTDDPQEYIPGMNAAKEYIKGKQTN